MDRFLIGFPELPASLQGLCLLSSSFSPRSAPMEEAEKSSGNHLELYSKSTSDSLDFHKKPTLTPEEEARVWRKTDIRLMPVLALLYLFSFLDRGMPFIRISPSRLTQHRREHRYGFMLPRLRITYTNQVLQDCKDWQSNWN